MAFEVSCHGNWWFCSFLDYRHHSYFTSPSCCLEKVCLGFFGVFLGGRRRPAAYLYILVYYAEKERHTGAQRVPFHIFCLLLGYALAAIRDNHSFVPSRCFKISPLIQFIYNQHAFHNQYLDKMCFRVIFSEQMLPLF